MDIIHIRYIKIFKNEDKLAYLLLNAEMYFIEDSVKQVNVLSYGNDCNSG